MAMASEVEQSDFNVGFEKLLRVGPDLRARNVLGGVAGDQDLGCKKVGLAILMPRQNITDGMCVIDAA
jgi:hypothetical protein